MAAGGTLTTSSFSQSDSAAVTTVNGRLAAADVYYTGGRINGTVTLAGTNANGTRRLTLGNNTLSGNTAFEFENGGEVANANSGGA